MNLEKYQALGNDYWVYDPSFNTEPLTLETVRALCNRHYGLGGDGVLVGPKSIFGGAFSVEIFNADGTLAEISGNGLTIFSKYLYNKHYVNLDEDFQIIPSALRKVHAVCFQKGTTIASKITFANGTCLETIPYNVPKDLQETLGLPKQLLLYKVDMGNPHCVVPVHQPTSKLACLLGPILEKHPSFPQKTNVQFVQWDAYLPKASIEIFERGSGYTLASGSSACAVACVYGHLFQQETYSLEVHMPGGTLTVCCNQSIISFTNMATHIASVKIVSW